MSAPDPAPDLSGRPELLQLLKHLDERAATALSADALTPADAQQLRKGRGRLQGVVGLLDEIIEKTRDGERAFEVNAKLNGLLWAAISGACLVGERSTFTRSAEKHIGTKLRKRQTATARAKRSAKRAQDREQDWPKIRETIGAAPRKTDGTLKNPGTLRATLAKQLNRLNLAPQTVRSWVQKADAEVSSDRTYSEDRKL